MARLLLVHESPEFLNLLHAIFAGEGFEICLAGSKTEALTLLEQTSCDLIVTDFQGPVGEPRPFAWSAWQEALARASGGTPVVVLTTYVSVAQCAPATLGVADIILQPFDVTNLVARVRAASRRPRSKRETSVDWDTGPAAWRQRW